MASKKKIGPIAKGKLHRNLGIPQGEPIGRARLQAAARSPNPTIRKEAQFPLNMHKGKK